MTTKRLYRSRNDRMVAGVCGGLAHYFGIDPTLVRLAFAVLLLIGLAVLSWPI
ncbi:MAG: PspC domain-containing protein [Caldilineaceae bacterium]